MKGKSPGELTVEARNINAPIELVKESQNFRGSL